MKHINFFAVKDDLLSILDLVEKRNSLQYIRTGQFPNRNLQRFSHGSELPKLGSAGSDSSINSDTYLVESNSAYVNWRSINRSNGEEWYSIDQMLNPDSVTFTPAGIWSESVILHGRIATISDSIKAQELMKEFNSAIKKNFRKVKAFWVGQGAYKLFEEGKRLTSSATSPVEFDLKE